MQIVTSTLSGNTADLLGGGIHSVGSGGDARVQIATSTLSDNAAAFGGSIYNLGELGVDASLEIGTTILKGGASGVTVSNSGGTVASRGYNLSSDDAGGLLTGPSDIVDADPMVDPLQDNGGPTFTHELLSGSPAIDGGPVGEICPGTDQRGCAARRAPPATSARSSTRPRYFGPGSRASRRRRGRSGSP